MQSNKISHPKITPLWPQGNAEAENFMKPLKKCVKQPMLRRKTGRQLQQFLLIYQATPRLTTHVAPTTALFGRTKLSSMP